MIIRNNVFNNVNYAMATEKGDIAVCYNSSLTLCITNNNYNNNNNLFVKIYVQLQNGWLTSGQVNCNIFQKCYAYLFRIINFDTFEISRLKIIDLFRVKERMLWLLMPLMD